MKRMRLADGSEDNGVEQHEPKTVPAAAAPSVPAATEALDPALPPLCPIPAVRPRP